MKNTMLTLRITSESINKINKIAKQLKITRSTFIRAVLDRVLFEADNRKVFLKNNKTVVDNRN
jgi:antitoxin component of RelBE/YafQ-DinJ toxin-antitoxin module